MKQDRAGLQIRVRGRVQGVGYRPWVARLANELGLSGSVRNAGNSVLIESWGPEAALEQLLSRLRESGPPMAQVDAVECEALQPSAPDGRFRIGESEPAHAGLAITPDLATCADCLLEMQDPLARRYRYPFTSCSQCGPRLSIQYAVPWDRDRTTMRRFALCAQCAAEYADPADRRYHAQQLACPACGPVLSYRTPSGDRCVAEAAMAAAIAVLRDGGIVAIKGTGGWQLACDATRNESLSRLRAGKCRPAKPFALMARDLDVIRSCATVSSQEAALLQGADGPIVLLQARPGRLPELVAPALNRYGFMLPHSPLHHLLLAPFEVPLVMTSGNRAGEPQLIDDAAACQQLAALVDGFLGHDREIAHRVDDSVLQSDGARSVVLRAGRGRAPLRFPAPGGDAGRRLLALGPQLKNTFAVVAAGQVVVSQHIGDLDTIAARNDQQRAQQLYLAQLEGPPDTIVTDLHPDYASTAAGEGMGRQLDVPVCQVQHHHAHLAACLLEHGWTARDPDVLGVVLDGLGLGDNGQLWGGEFLLGGFRRYERLATFKPVALLGGMRAMHEPWRNAYAHLMAELGMPWLNMNFRHLELYQFLESRDPALLEPVLADRRLSPLASSCGRLFDAVAAAIGICREQIAYEGHAAMALEAVIDSDALADCSEDAAYPFSIPSLHGTGLPYIEPVAMWQALLGDLHLGIAPGVIAARFHRGLAAVVVRMVARLQGAAGGSRFTTVVLSGGVFQNQTLCGLVTQGLVALGIRVLLPGQLPAGDGGVAAGQAAVVMAGGGKQCVWGSRDRSSV